MFIIEVEENDNHTRLILSDTDTASSMLKWFQDKGIESSSRVVSESWAQEFVMDDRSYAEHDRVQEYMDDFQDLVRRSDLERMFDGR